MMPEEDSVVQNDATDTIGVCTACFADESRRDFLRRAALLAVALAASVGASGAAAEMPLRVARRLSAAGPTKTYTLPEQDGAEIDRDSEVILVRWQNQVFAFALSCPHQHTALRWNPTDARFQCPKHHSQYSPDGTFIKGRATRGMDRLAISRQGNTVVVTTEPLIKQTENMAAWQAAVIQL
jgi:nitrite reductase/ring-hydroxylating ferredoxin subunit